jgi:hypothetical protein
MCVGRGRVLGGAQWVDCCEVCMVGGLQCKVGGGGRTSACVACGACWVPGYAQVGRVGGRVGGDMTGLVCKKS